MQHLPLKTLLAGAAAFLFIAGCSDSTAPPPLQAPDGEALSSTGDTEIHRGLVAGPYVDFDLTHRLLPGYAIERGLPAVLVYRYGETSPSVYEGYAFYVDVEVRYPDGSIDPDYRGTLWTMVETGTKKNQYNVYYRFDLYRLTGGKTLIGTFLAREQANCGNFPCATRSDVEVLELTGTGVFENGFSALMTTFRSTLKEDPGFGVMQYVWLNGTLDWTTSAPPPAENQPPSASFTYSCTDLTCSFTDTSSDSDGTIEARAWTFGDGATSTAQNPSHTYGASSTYTVTLTVTDNDGATGTASQNVTVSSPGEAVDISLSVNAYRVQGRKHADLSWSGATTTSVDIYRDGSVIVTVTNSGAYTHATTERGGGSHTYQVCEAGGEVCSNTVVVTY